MRIVFSASYNTKIIVSLFIVLKVVSSQTLPSVRQLATFEGFAENIAVRSNGDILVTSLTTSSVHILKPNQSNTTNVLPPIPGANGISGIVEVDQDVFAIAAGIWNMTARRETNAAIWTIDLRNYPHKDATLTNITYIPETTILNSLTAVPGSTIVLASDSSIGAIYAIDLARHTYSIAIQDPVLAPGPSPWLGVNGIKVWSSHLYFAVSGTGAFGRFPISRIGHAIGPVQLITYFNATIEAGPDDFVLDEEGIAWVALHPRTVYRVDRLGRKEVLVSGDQIRDPTSVTFGRGKNGKWVLYASVNVFGEIITGGVDEIEFKV